MADENEHGERLARLETSVIWQRRAQKATLRAVRTMHADLKAHLKDEGDRLDRVEQEQAKVKTHFGWMKAIWAFVSAGLGFSIWSK